MPKPNTPAVSLNAILFSDKRRREIKNLPDYRIEDMVFEILLQDGYSYDDIKSDLFRIGLVIGTILGQAH